MDLNQSLDAPRSTDFEDDDFDYFDYEEPQLLVPSIVPIGTQERAAKIPDGLFLDSGVATTNSSLKPQATYYGRYPGTRKVGLRISNGAAGQSGLLGAWGDAFINYMVERKKHQPFTVEWYLGDTTESIGLLEHHQVDVAVTYHEEAERQVQNNGSLSAWLYGFRDHFYFVGPKSNPAKLDKGETIYNMLQKIVKTGNEHVVKPPTNGPPTRFLSRYDKSATNMKESELFIKIGQVPWGYVYSKWYHQYPRFPLQALDTASKLGEYTLTDRGTWFSSSPSVRSRLEVYKAGSDDDKDPLIMPAHVLVGKLDKLIDRDIGKAFIEWVQMYDVKNREGGQYVVETYKGKPSRAQIGSLRPEPKVPLYTKAPPGWRPGTQ